MSILKKLWKILENGETEYKNLRATNESNFYDVEKFCCHNEKIENHNTDKLGTIAMGDNVEFMNYLLNKGIKIDLIYIDPPFYSQLDYNQSLRLFTKLSSEIKPIKQKAYTDTWEKGLEEYLTMITVRLFMMRELLSEKGSIWVHLDWHSAHYVKVLMDEIYGAENFLNEIIWNYKSGGASKNTFAKKHDTLLFYRKSKKNYFKGLKEKSYNREFKPYRFKNVEEFKDETGWYTMVNMKDVWQIDMVGRTSSERTGYATQKPEALLRRIIESCTEGGDLCADFFGGSGTLAVTAGKMGRSWIACDKGELSVASMEKRFMKEGFQYILKCNEKIDAKYECKNIVFIVEKAHEEAKNVTKIILKSYSIDRLEDLSLEKKSIEALKKIEKLNPLQFVDYWGIDLNYNGVFFNSCNSTVRKEDYISNTLTGIEGSGEIAIKVVDVFGKKTILKIIKG